MKRFGSKHQKPRAEQLRSLRGGEAATRRQSSEWWGDGSAAWRHQPSREASSSWVSAVNPFSGATSTEGLEDDRWWFAEPAPDCINSLCFRVPRRAGISLGNPWRSRRRIFHGLLADLSSQRPYVLFLWARGFKTWGEIRSLIKTEQALPLTSPILNLTSNPYRKTLLIFHRVTSRPSPLGCGAALQKMNLLARCRVGKPTASSLTAKPSPRAPYSRLSQVCVSLWPLFACLGAWYPWFTGRRNGSPSSLVLPCGRRRLSERWVLA